MLRNDVSHAKTLLEAALALDPTIAMAHKNLGIIYAEYLHDPEQAVAHYQRYLELGPDRDAAAVREYIAKAKGR